MVPSVFTNVFMNSYGNYCILNTATNEVSMKKGNEIKERNYNIESVF